MFIRVKRGRADNVGKTDDFAFIVMLVNARIEMPEQSSKLRRSRDRKTGQINAPFMLERAALTIKRNSRCGFN